MCREGKDWKAELSLIVSFRFDVSRNVRLHFKHTLRLMTHI